MRQFVIPSRFTAIDSLSSVLGKMGSNVSAFAAKAETALARSERVFRKLTPTISAASKELLSLAGSAAIAGGIVSTAFFSVDALKKYENGLASFRTIVSDLTDKDFAKYQEKVAEVAFDTKKSTVDVVAAFESIAGLNSKFADTAESIGSVSKASIILAKASKMELQPAAENLVSIMNQYSLGANQANRTINVLAAGQAVGAANISQTAESFKNFGSVAASANISLEESVALIQTVGKFSLFGAEAGTKLRGSVLRLQAANLGYASGQFNVNDALEEARKKIDRLSTAKAKDAALDKIFGAENISTGRILLSNITTFQEYTRSVIGTSEAQKAAEINSKTLTNRLEELKAKWVNIITTSDKAGSALDATKSVVGFLTDNMETLVSWGTKALLFFGAWKAALVAGRIALIAYNIGLGVTGALSATASIAIGQNAIALGAYKVTAWAAAAATQSLNFVMALNPWVAAAIAIGAVIAAISLLITKYETLEEHQNKAVKANKIEGFQKEKQALLETASAYEKYGRSKAQAQQMSVANAQKLLEADRASAYYQLNSATNDSERRVAERVLSDIEGRGAAIQSSSEIFSESDVQRKEAVDMDIEKADAMQRITSIQRQNVAIDIRDNTGKASVRSDNNFVPVKLTSTQGF
jgi:TP901 family phage tail tape measure protein